LNNLININSIKIQNRRIVFKHIERNDNIPRNELAALSQVSLGTVSTILEEFSQQGIISEVKDERSTVGRKPNLIHLIPKAKKIISIEMTSVYFSFEIQDLQFVRYTGENMPYNHAFDFQKNLEILGKKINECLQNNGIVIKDVIGVGVSVPGHYRWEEDRIVKTIFTEFLAQHVKEYLEKYFSLRVLVKNSIRLATSAEIESLNDYEDKIIKYIYLGDEVGGALVTKGEVYSGARGFAGDIGQLIVDGTSTLEEKVSWRNFIAQLPELMGLAPEKIQSEILTRFVDKEPRVYALVMDVCRYLAKGITEVFWLLDPHCIMLSGKYNFLGESFIEHIRSELRTLLQPDLTADLCITFSTFHERATLIGAGKMVRDFWIRHLN